MKEDNNEFVKVACLSCGEKIFSFSRNTLVGKKGSCFMCPYCNCTTQFSLAGDGNIEVMCF